MRKSKIVQKEFSFLRSPEGKRILKLLTISILVIMVIVVGVFLYVTDVNRKTYEKFVRARSLYLQAKATAEEEKLTKLREAVSLFEEVTKQKTWWGNKEEALFYLASCLHELGDDERSVLILQEFEKKFPRSYFSPWVKLKLGLLYENKKDYRKAEKIYQEIVEKFGQSSVAPEALLGQARCKESQGSYEEARKLYSLLISRYPLSSQAILGEAKLQQLTLQEKKG